MAWLAVEGFLAALGILALVGLLIWLYTLGLPYEYGVTREGVRIVLFRHICVHRISARRITGVWLQESPAGQLWGHGIALTFMSHPFAGEGVVIECKGNVRVYLTPKAPQEFIRRAAECGLGGAEPGGASMSGPPGSAGVKLGSRRKP